MSRNSLVVLKPAAVKTRRRPDRRHPEISIGAGTGSEIRLGRVFFAHIRNRHTRIAYRRAVLRFLNWSESQEIPLPHITPGDVGEYFDAFPGSIPTRKLHLAGLRAFFDVLVERHVVVLNPAASLRGERYSVVEGKTPEITPDQVGTLLASIDATTPVGLRDRAVVATLIFTAARAGAISALTMKHLVSDGSQYSLQFNEKNNRAREIPVRHDLQLYLQAYIERLPQAEEQKDLPLFRTAPGKGGKFTANPMTGVDIYRMVYRRLRDAGLPTRLSPHSFRVCAVTDLLSQGVALEDVQYLAGYVVNHISFIMRSGWLC